MKTTLTALALVVGLWAARPAAAGPITTPAGLNPGDQFRIIFVSSDVRDATSANIADYDTFITTLANAAGLTYNGASVTWQALGSTPSVEANASGRLPVDPSSPALYRLDGVRVANNTSDLWDFDVDAAINVNELGMAVPELAVWTGTDPDGRRALPLGSPDHDTSFGITTATSSDWVSASFGVSENGRRLYGYSEVLTVPGTAAVPEPTSLTLVLVGIAGLAGTAIARRQRRASPAP